MTQAASQQSRPVNEYLRTKVLTASPEELRLLLLDGALKFGRQGRDGIARKDYEASYEGITQCRNIVFELLTTIRDEPDAELAKNARALYAFLYRQLIDAGHRRDTAALDKVLELLAYERETWVLVMEKLGAERGEGAAAAASVSVQG